MSRKDIGKVITTILTALTFIIIGSTFSAFVYRKELIEVKNPKVILAEGVNVYDENGEKEISELELSKMKLGLKPTTGEEDAETNIPTTVTDKQGSEGQYAKFAVLAPAGVNVYITNVKIESKEDENKIKEERKNIMVAIKELDESTSSLEKDKTLLGKINAGQEKQTMTFYVWLSSKVSDILESSEISFEISFEALS